MTYIPLNTPDKLIKALINDEPIQFRAKVYSSFSREGWKNTTFSVNNTISTIVTCMNYAEFRINKSETPPLLNINS